MEECGVGGGRRRITEFYVWKVGARDVRNDKAGGGSGRKRRGVYSTSRG